MADYILYYLQTLLTPLLALIVIACILRYCCKIFRKASHIDSDLDLSNSDHIYVIPNPIHLREDRDETDSSEDSEYTPPPYELVCPPPSYLEASFKLSISDVEVIPNVPPPPYSPPLPSQSSSHQQ